MSRKTPAIGIDVGSTFSKVAAFRKGKVVIIPDKLGHLQIPASSLSFTQIKEMAEAYLRKPVVEAVISVPACYNNVQREDTKAAATVAGLKVRLLNKPSAAAYAYGFENKNNNKRNLLIFRLGGGSCDASIVTSQGGDFIVKSSVGDSCLGGEIFTGKIVKLCVQTFHSTYGNDTNLWPCRLDNVEFERLRNACELAKRQLTDDNKADIVLDSLVNDTNFRLTIKREKFEQMNEANFFSLLDLIIEALRGAGMDKSKIHDVLLIGGSTRIPKIEKLIKIFFHGTRAQFVSSTTFNPEEAVVRGAAIKAATLLGYKSDALQNLALQDVTPLPLGVEKSFGLMDLVFERFTPIPSKKTSMLQCTSTSSKSDTALLYEGRLGIYEGHHHVVRHNRKLGEAVIGFQRENLSEPDVNRTVQVTFTIDDDGILSFEAEDAGDSMLII